MSAGSLTLGGNLSIALGPLGRNGEALGSVSTSGKVAAMFVIYSTLDILETDCFTGIATARRRACSGVHLISHPQETFLIL